MAFVWAFVGLVVIIFDWIPDQVRDDKVYGLCLGGFFYFFKIVCNVLFFFATCILVNNLTFNVQELK